MQPVHVALATALLSLTLGVEVAGAQLPDVAVSRVAGGALQQSFSAQEGMVINRYDSTGQRISLDIIPIDPSALPTGQILPVPVGTDPYGANPLSRNHYRDNFGFRNGFAPGAVWLGARESAVPFYASCQYSDFRGNTRNCDQDYQVAGGSGDPQTLNDRLTAQQEALLGCGPFWGTNCDEQGIDLLNMDASVLLQAFPGIDGTGTPFGQDPDTSGGQWRMDGLEPGAPVQALGRFEAGGAFFPFLGQARPNLRGAMVKFR